MTCSYVPCLEAVHNGHLLVDAPAAAETVYSTNSLFHCGWIPSEIEEHHMPAVVVKVDTLLRLGCRDEDEGSGRQVELLDVAFVRIGVCVVANNNR